MRFDPKLLIVAGALSALGALALLGGGAETTPDVAAPPAAAPVGPAADLTPAPLAPRPTASPAHPSRHYHYRPGVAERYRFRYRTELGDGKQVQMRSELAGVLERQVLSADATGAWIALRPSQVQIGGLQQPADAVAAAAARLERELLVRVDPRGRTERYRFDPGMTARERNLLKALVCGFRIVLGGGPAWRAQEADLTGTFDASYAAQSAEGGALQVSKSFDRYRQLFSQGRGAGQVQVRFRAEASVDPGAGRVLSVTLRARYRATAGAGGPFFDCSIDGSLVRIGPGVARRGGLASRIRSTVAGRAQGPERGEAHDVALRQADDVPALDGAGLGRLIAELSADQTDRLHRALRRLARQLEAHPEAIAELLELAADPRYPTATAGLLLGVIATLRQPAGPRAVLEFARRSDQPRIRRLQAIAALANAPAADAALASDLERLASGAADELRGAALLALGGVAYQLGQGGKPDVRHQIARGLAERLERATRPGWRLRLIAALGNAGDPSNRALLLELIERSDSRAERDEAVAALRRIPGAETDRALVQLVRGPRPMLRPVALAVLATRPSAAAERELRYASSSDDEALRRAAAESSGQVASWNPTLAAHLRRQATRRGSSGR